MDKGHQKSQRGFTIIEVVLVLAIAGLIFLLAFLALSTAQMMARNTQRKNDAAITGGYVRQYITNRGNRLPTSCNNMQQSCFVREIELSFYDNKSLESNNLSFWNRTRLGPFRDDFDEQLSPSDLHRIVIRTYSRCNGKLMTGDGAKWTDTAIQYVVETIGGGEVQCLEL